MSRKMIFLFFFKTLKFVKLNVSNLAREIVIGRLELFNQIILKDNKCIDKVKNRQFHQLQK